MRGKNFSALLADLSDVPDTIILNSNSSAAPNSHYCMTVVLSGELAPHRNDIMMDLKGKGIGCCVYYHQQVFRMTYYKEKYGYEDGRYPNAEAISDHSIELPVGPHLQDEDLKQIALFLRES